MNRKLVSLKEIILLRKSKTPEWLIRVALSAATQSENSHDRAIFTEYSRVYAVFTNEDDVEALSSLGIPETFPIELFFYLDIFKMKRSIYEKQLERLCALIEFNLINQEPFEVQYHNIHFTTFETPKLQQD